MYADDNLAYDLSRFDSSERQRREEQRKKEEEARKIRMAPAMSLSKSGKKLTVFIAVAALFTALFAVNYFNAKKEPNPKDNIFHDCFALKFNRRYSFDNTDTNNISEIDSDQDENTLKNVVSSKGKFASYLQARNLSKKYNI